MFDLDMHELVAVRKKYYMKRGEGRSGMIIKCLDGTILEYVIEGDYWSPLYVDKDDLFMEVK